MNSFWKYILLLNTIGNICQGYSIKLTKENEENSSPCYAEVCNIAIVFDTSSDILSNEIFVKTKNILQNNISTEILHFNQLSTITFSKNINVSNFGMFKNKEDFSELVDSLKQSPGFNLSMALASANNLKFSSINKASTFVFISKYDEEEIKKSIKYANQLHQKGSLSFIILGEGIKPIQLLPFQPSSIYLIDFKKNDINQLENFFYNSLSCFPKGCSRNKIVQ